MRFSYFIATAFLSVNLSGCVVLPKPPAKNPSVIMPQAVPQSAPRTSSDCWDGSDFDKDGLCPPKPIPPLQPVE